MRKFTMILAAATMLVGAQAFAGFVLAPHWSYEKAEVDNNGTTSDGGAIELDFNIGYTMPTGLFLGGIYDMWTGDAQGMPSLNTTDASDSGSAYGASVGYVGEGFNIIASYLLSATHKSEDGSLKAEFKEGTGIQLTLGYKFMLGKTFGLGPQLRYRSIEFKKRDIGAGDVEEKYKVTTTQPMVGMWFMF